MAKREQWEFPVYWKVASNEPTSRGRRLRLVRGWSVNHAEPGVVSKGDLKGRDIEWLARRLFAATPEQQAERERMFARIFEGDDA